MKQILLLTALVLIQSFSFAQSFDCYRSSSATNNYISKVNLFDINNSSTYNIQGYQNFLNIFTGLTKGKTYTITVNWVNLNVNGSTRKIAAWIDFNNDLYFTENERILGTTSNVTGSYSASFVVPANAVLGKKRMRVNTQFNSLPGYSPCSVSYGEAEDYTVNICNYPNIPQSITICPNTSYSLTSSGAQWNSFWANHPADHSPAGEISINQGTSTTVYGRIGRTPTKYWLWASSYGCDNHPYEIYVNVKNCLREGDIEEVKQINSSLIENQIEVNNPNNENISINFISMDGKVIFQKLTANDKTIFDATNLINGMYLLNITNSLGEHFNEKIVINK